GREAPDLQGLGTAAMPAPTPTPPQAGEGDLRPLIAGESPFSVYAGDSPFPLSAGDPRHCLFARDPRHCLFARDPHHCLFAGSRTSHCSRASAPPPVHGGRLGGGRNLLHTHTARCVTDAKRQTSRDWALRRCLPLPRPSPASGGGRAASSDCVLGAKHQACRGLGTAAGLAPTPTPRKRGRETCVLRLRGSRPFPCTQEI